MKVPNADQAVVPRAKVFDYLLSETHFHGRHKAALFRRFGFAAENWQELAAALKGHVEEHEIAKEEPSPFGRRFVVEGIMQMPDGRTPLIRTIWFLRSQQATPCFVTAYPLKQRPAKE
jgi:hypothetical protein